MIKKLDKNKNYNKREFIYKNHLFKKLLLLIMKSLISLFINVVSFKIKGKNFNLIDLYLPKTTYFAFCSIVPDKNKIIEIYIINFT